MRKLLLTLFLGCLVAMLHAQDRHVILISIDGLRPDFYRDHSWPAPNIQHMAGNGASADYVRSVFPSVTYPSHTTILTGAMPARHGIYYNAPFEPDGQTGRWYWEEELIKTSTLWDAAKEKGLVAANLFWPVSVGAPVNYNVPEVWPLDREADPYEFAKGKAIPESLPEELEESATGMLNESTFSMDWSSRDVRTGFMAAHLIETYQPNFLTVHLVGVDHFQHEQGRDGLEVRRSLQGADYAIGQIRDACIRAGIMERTAIIVTGDHGFSDIHTTLYPNNWLVGAGLLGATRDRGDWKASFHTSGAAAFLHIKNPNDQKVLREVTEILERLPVSRKKLFRVLIEEDLQQIGADPNVKLALAPVEGVNLSSYAAEEDIAAANGGTHGFFPDYPDIHTGFIGFGAGFRSGSVAPLLGLEDIAPLISELLDLDFKAPDGTLFPGLLQPVED